MTKSSPHPELDSLYRRAVEAIPGVPIKGAKNLYTSLNGNMYSFRSADGDLAFRLPQADRAAFLEKHPDAICVQYGTVMKDYVKIPQSLLDDVRLIKKLFAASHDHAHNLKPKPTTRKKASTKSSSGSSQSPKRALRKKK